MKDLAWHRQQEDTLRLSKANTLSYDPPEMSWPHYRGGPGCHYKSLLWSLVSCVLDVVRETHPCTPRCTCDPGQDGNCSGSCPVCSGPQVQSLMSPVVMWGWVMCPQASIRKPPITPHCNQRTPSPYLPIKNKGSCVHPVWAFIYESIHTLVHSFKQVWASICLL